MRKKKEIRVAILTQSPILSHMATDSSDQLNFNPTTTTEKKKPKQTLDDDTTTTAVTPTRSPRRRRRERTNR